VTSGLKPGDQVLLSPPFDTQEKDLGGAIIADGEAPPPATTNGPAVAPLDRSEHFSGTGTNRSEMLKKFDADGDGKLSESELAVLRLWSARHAGTNDLPIHTRVN
jgi:hypothetical protein